MASQERNIVLICYNPKDKEYAQEAQAQLAQTLGAGNLELWEAQEDSQLDNWQRDTEAAIARAKVAVLLVSSEFLNSSAVSKVLFSFLFGAIGQAGLRILPVIVSRCLFLLTPLAYLKAANDPYHTLSEITAEERAAFWEKLAREIKEPLFSAASSRTQEPTVAPAQPQAAPMTVELQQAEPEASMYLPTSSYDLSPTSLPQAAGSGPLQLPQTDDTQPDNPSSYPYISQPTYVSGNYSPGSQPSGLHPPQPGYAAPPPPDPPGAGRGWWRNLRFPGGEKEQKPKANPVRHLEIPGAAAEPSPPSAEPPHFAAFSPREVTAETWNTLLAYVHIAPALEQVRQDARKFQPELGQRPREATSAASQPVARGTEISFVPSGQGITFNPSRVSFTWLEDWQRANFRFLVSKALAGAAATGEITVYAGPIIVATLTFGVLVEERPIPEPERVPVNEASSRVYQRIFTSYSHKDTPVVLACRNTYKGLGLEVLIDIDTLRSGQVWNAELLRMIDRSDVFQLFWSPRSAQSEYVRQEWQHALKRNQGVGFIRPVYWELPLVAPPQELSHLHFMYMPLPKLDVPMSAYDQAIQTDPINAIAYHAKGDALSDQGRYNGALSYYERAAQLEPGYAPTWTNKGSVLYMLGRNEEAVAALDRAIQLQPGNALAHLLKVPALAKLQRYAEALAACDQVIRLQPNDASSYNNKGTTLLMMGRFEEAAATYQQAIQLHSTYGVAYRNLGIALERLGRRAEAAQAYQKARELGAF